jgi:hypothetical protein
MQWPSYLVLQYILQIALQRKTITLKYSFQNIKKMHMTIQCFFIDLLNQQDNKYT